MKTPSIPKPTETTTEWGLYCHAESRLQQCREALDRLTLASWQQPMKDQEQRIAEDTKLKPDEKAAQMTHERRVERMSFWKEVYAIQLKLTQTRLREAEWTMEHWDEQPVISIRKRTSPKKGLLM